MTILIPSIPNYFNQVKACWLKNTYSYQPLLPKKKKEQQPKLNFQEINKYAQSLETTATNKTDQTVSFKNYQQYQKWKKNVEAEKQIAQKGFPEPEKLKELQQQLWNLTTSTEKSLKTNLLKADKEGLKLIKGLSSHLNNLMLTSIFPVYGLFKDLKELGNLGSSLSKDLGFHLNLNLEKDLQKFGDWLGKELKGIGKWIELVLILLVAYELLKKL